MDWEELRKKERARQFRKKHKLRDPEDESAATIKKKAHVRESIHEGKTSQRKLSKDYEVIGVAGEEAFKLWIGGDPDTVKASKKRNVNHIVKGREVNVLCARKPTFLLVEKGKARAQFYVLAQYRELSLDARLIGWATREDVDKAPLRDIGGFGIMSHAIDARDLRPMSDLKVELGLAPVQPSLFEEV